MASAPAGIPRPRDPSLPRARPRELEDPLNHFIYHPLAARLARLLRPTGVSPNAVSVAGGLLIWAAAWAYTSLAWPVGALLGFLFHVSWHVVDGADGDLARLTGKTSPTGELVDGICDYAGHGVLYIAFAALLDDSIGGWAWFLSSAAAASHIVQTNHAESQRRNYLWWAYGVPWLKHAQASGDAVFARKGWFSVTFGWLAQAYIHLADAMNPGTATVEKALAEAAGDPERTQRIRRIARHGWARALLLQKALGANPKTILVGASIALNLLLVFSIWYHNRCSRRLVRAIARL
jgi:phosphatidylglycerophosphate synthase